MKNSSLQRIGMAMPIISINHMSRQGMSSPTYALKEWVVYTLERETLKKDGMEMLDIHSNPINDLRNDIFDEVSLKPRSEKLLYVRTTTGTRNYPIREYAKRKCDQCKEVRGIHLVVSKKEVATGDLKHYCKECATLMLFAEEV